jgi:hypothetical protein
MKNSESLEKKKPPVEENELTRLNEDQYDNMPVWKQNILDFMELFMNFPFIKQQ